MTTGTNQDCSIGVTGSTSGESAYKTYTAVSRWFEFNDESLNWKKNVKQGKGLRVAGRVDRSGRRQVPTADGNGDITMEILSKGMGLLWQAAFGSATSTVVSASSAYQQTFILGDTPVSLSIQKGIPEVGGTVDAYTFLGAMVDSFDIDIKSDDIPTAKFTFDIGDLNTSAGGGTSFAAVTEPTSATNFNGGQVTATLGGTLTVPNSATPTKATVAGGATTVGVRNFSLTVNNNLTKDRFNFLGTGRKSKPTVGMRAISGKITFEYDATTYVENFKNDTAMCLVIDVVGAAIPSGSGRTEGFQVVLPAVYLEGDLPKANAGDLITIDASFTVLDNLTAAQPIWFVVTTADTAL